MVVVDGESKIELAIKWYVQDEVNQEESELNIMQAIISQILINLHY